MAPDLHQAGGDRSVLNPYLAEEVPRLARVVPGCAHAPLAGGMLLVPHREPGMDESALPADYQAIMKMVTAASEAVPAKDFSVQFGRGSQPGQVEPVRDELRRLADRGWLHRTPAGRFTALPQPSV